MTDEWNQSYDQNFGPAADATSITPDDGTVLTATTKGLYVGVGGDLAVRMKDGTTLTFIGVGSGAILPLRVDIVLATGTTATDIIALH